LGQNLLPQIIIVTVLHIPGASNLAPSHKSSTQAFRRDRFNHLDGCPKTISRAAKFWWDCLSKAAHRADSVHEGAGIFSFQVNVWHDRRKLSADRSVQLN
jgi:hypothetical protein